MAGAIPSASEEVLCDPHHRHPAIPRYHFRAKTDKIVEKV